MKAFIFEDKTPGKEIKPILIMGEEDLYLLLGGTGV